MKSPWNNGYSDDDDNSNNNTVFLTILSHVKSQVPDKSYIE